MITLYFTNPPGGLDSNREVVDSFRESNPGIASVLEDTEKTRWSETQHNLVLMVDVDPSGVTQAQLSAAIGGVESIYNVTHVRTVKQ